MGVDCSVILPHEAGLDDIASVMGLLLGAKGELKPLSQGGGLHLKVEGVEIKPSSMAECPSIHIADALMSDGSRGERRIMFHYEYNTRSRRDVYTTSGRGILPSCTALNIALCVELARFFGGEVDYNNCDAKQANFKAPKAKDLLACNGKKWDDFQRRMAAVKPLTKTQIDKYQKYAAY